MLIMRGVIGQLPHNGGDNRYNREKFMKYRYVLIVGFACILFFLLINMLALVFGTPKKGTYPYNQNPSGIPSPLQPTTGQTFPGTTNTFPIPTESVNDQKLLNRIENRQQLEQNDTTAKQKIINSLSPSTETVYQTSDFTIDYVRTPDVFQVEIDSTDVAKAKSEAVAWFESQGISYSGICRLPVMFYLNFYIKRQGYTISPLADGC